MDTVMSFDGLIPFLLISAIFVFHLFYYLFCFTFFFFAKWGTSQEQH